MTFVLTPLAEADLAEIADYVTDEASADRAEAVVLELMAAAGRLADMPRMGHSRADLTDEPVLFWPVFSYLIVYRPEVQPIQIVRIVHGARGPGTIAEALREPRSSD